MTSKRMMMVHQRVISFHCIFIGVTVPISVALHMVLVIGLLIRCSIRFFGFLRGVVDSQHELCARITTQWLLRVWFCLVRCWAAVWFLRTSITHRVSSYVFLATALPMAFSFHSCDLQSLPFPSRHLHTHSASMFLLFRSFCLLVLECQGTVP